jgi:hypothetical protein
VCVREGWRRKRSREVSYYFWGFGSAFNSPKRAKTTTYDKRCRAFLDVWVQSETSDQMSNTTAMYNMWFVQRVVCTKKVSGNKGVGGKRDHFDRFVVVYPQSPNASGRSCEGRIGN